MAKIKSYTDLEQSRKLAEILPLESADMCYPPYYIGDEDGDHLYYSLPVLEHKDKCAYNRENKDEYIPCWSVGALLEVMPASVRISKNCDGNYNLGYKNFDTKEYLYMIDACFEMILKLNELNLL